MNAQISSTCLQQRHSSQTPALPDSSPCILSSRIPTTTGWAVGSRSQGVLTASTSIGHVRRRHLTLCVRRLQSLIDTLDPTALRERYIRIMSGPNAAANRRTIQAHKACARSLLSLRVLVQNRRKDKIPILVFASGAAVQALAASTAAVAQGAPQCKCDSVELIANHE